MLSQFYKTNSLEISPSIKIIPITEAETTNSMEQNPFEKLTGSQLVQKFPELYGARRFITAFKITSTFPYPEPNQSNPWPHPISWISILILSSDLPLGLPSASFTQVSPKKRCMHLFAPNTCYMPRQSHSSWFYHPNNVWWGDEIVKFFVMQTFPLPSYLLPLRPKYPPQRCILEITLHIFLPRRDRKTFTLIKNKRQNYDYIYLIFMFLDRRLDGKICLHRMTASISRLQCALNPLSTKLYLSNLKTLVVPRRKHSLPSL